MNVDATGEWAGLMERAAQNWERHGLMAADAHLRRASFWLTEAHELPPDVAARAQDTITRLLAILTTHQQVS